ncbi:MAG: DNA mismatch repair endonuclease MutL [Lachnospiraceae bacterium]|nr:DNA mismatch repair endonuclease MutL [Lachnospiraceae bacterium]
MANIKVLDQNTINQIAAGEVIERPASVVKELLENAIDAKATAITIEIKEGGISFIRITDNGCGIAKEDIPLAFLRHSTSKIRTAIDLLTVASLGFRGEALSSIAAVSMVELITKSQEAFCGTRYVIEGGEEKSAEDIGVPNGTTFIVRNLFYNTPARRKFLKSATTETSYISDIIEKIALSHPEISIRFICNNQNRLHTSGNGSLKDVIYTVYNREIAANLIEINRECDFMKITGYIGKPIISRGNRSYENYFINGRYIKSGFISRAIEDAYKSFMMQHKYPFTCINIEINPELLDVNVHPTKMELRFRNHEEIYPFTFKVLDDALHKRELIPEVKLDEDENISKAESNTERRAGNKPVNVRMPEPFETERMKSEKHEVKQPEIEKSGIEKHEVKQPEIEKSGIEKHEVKQPEIEKPEVKQPEVEKTLDNLLRENFDYKTKNTTTSIIEKSEQLELFDDRLLSKKARITHKIVGQVFDTYWIVEYDNKMFIIDQHAAHEKVLYERIVKRYRERENLSQEINPPIVVSLNMREEELLKKNMEHFKSFGYEIEEFGGNEYAIRAVPYDLLSLSDRDLFIEFLDSLSPDDKINENIEMLIDRMATMACKAAVKGNNRLSVKEADELIEELLNLDNPYNCPHGRPTIISMTKYEVEKKFKRIV